MVRYVLKRIGYMIITFFVIVTLTFIAMKLLPGTPFKTQSRLSPEQLAQLRHYYGLDQPIPVQYVQYLWHALHGDLGGSFQYGMRPITTMLAEKFPVSLDLGLEAIILGAIIGILLGIVAGIKRGTFIDYGSMIISVLGISIPSFIFAVFLQYYFAVKNQWLPVAEWNGGISYHILPVVALSVAVIANVARFMRTEMVEVLGQDYIITAKAKGISSTAVVFKHAVRNAMIPVITILGPLTAAIITGSLVIENIFAIPGIGNQFVESILTNDYPMIMGTTELYAALFIITVFIVDILYVIIDPRIRLTGGDA
ncbi:ABC transporter permease [Terrilactibacillus laevilacticus]|uniref:ABC transporter permease n=1 Tax=Terrilactibacillus laevilacticus TaxID=1380157 RepID=A0ABW5PQE5_9BACI|nr:ABC transporter permease [Terrilactibacillus laevilacticus]